MEEPLAKKHHVREELCVTRPTYRDGRKLKAVKVYTVSQESEYLLVQGIRAINLKTEVEALFSKFGEIADCTFLDDYTREQFTDVALIKFVRIQSARFAKKFLDEYNFYGGILHVCYAPEYETVEETSLKLKDRKKSVMRRIRQLNRESEKANKQDAEVEEGGNARDTVFSHNTGTEDETGVAGNLDERPVVIELPEEFFLNSDDRTVPEIYPSLPAPPWSGAGSLPPMYPSQAVFPATACQSQSHAHGYQSYAYMAPPH